MHSFLERPKCPVCSAGRTRELFVADLATGEVGDYLARVYGRHHADELRGHTFRLDECTECSTVFQHYVGDAAFLGALYDDWLNTPENRALAEATPHDASGASRDANELIWASRTLQKPLPDLRTLDYGMGWGSWARIAKALGCASHGFDLSRQRMAAAEAHGVRVVDEHHLPAGYFDFINTEQVFEHVPEPLELARRLSAALAPGGILKVSVPNGSDIRTRLAAPDWRCPDDSPRSLNAVAPLEHVNCFSKRAIATMGTAVGLTVEPERILPQYSFVTQPRALRFSSPKAALKELLRPWYRFRNRHTLYVWLRAHIHAD